MKVKHKQTNEELTVSADYYHKYQGRLELVEGKEEYAAFKKAKGITQSDIEKALSDSKLADEHEKAVKKKPAAPKAPSVEPKEDNGKLTGSND